MENAKNLFQQVVSELDRDINAGASTSSTPSVEKANNFKVKTRRMWSVAISVPLKPLSTR